MISITIELPINAKDRELLTEIAGLHLANKTPKLRREANISALPRRRGRKAKTAAAEKKNGGKRPKAGQVLIELAKKKDKISWSDDIIPALEAHKFSPSAALVKKACDDGVLKRVSRGVYSLA